MPNLHEALIKVQDQLTAWNQWASSKRNPVIPTGVESLAVDTSELYENLNRLQDMLAPAESETERLTRVDAGELHDVLSKLVEDSHTLHTLPERTIVIDQLTEQGLEELLADFQARGVSSDQVTLELEVAWWQSALEAMVSADEHLAATTGKQLSRLEEEFRIADTAHRESGPSRIRHTLATRWEKATRDYPDAADSLRRLLRTGGANVETILSINPNLLQPLVPILTTSPLSLAELPPSVTFDTVLVLDSETIGMATGLGAISRADQVVAFGDAVSGRPVGFQVSIDPTARPSHPRQA
ncbi:MAG: AAA family ATPase, partial [Yaniella sp.]|nr:AAA family ATPase [Yaniella sp.]